MFIDLENEIINDMSNRLKDNLFIIIAKKSRGEEKNKRDLKLFANSFY